MRHRTVVVMLALEMIGVTLTAGGLLGQAATVEVENRLDRDMLVWIDGDPRGVAPANGRVTFDGLRDGSVTLLATGLPDRGVEASERRVLAAGETFSWILYPIPVLGEEKGTGILVVTNELETPAQVMVGGAVLGWVSPSGTRSFPNLVAGSIPVEARDAEQRLLEKADVRLADGEVERWVIGGPETR